MTPTICVLLLAFAIIHTNDAQDAGMAEQRGETPRNGMGRPSQDFTRSENEMTQSEGFSRGSATGMGRISARRQGNSGSEGMPRKSLHGSSGSNIKSDGGADGRSMNHGRDLVKRDLTFKDLDVNASVDLREETRRAEPVRMIEKSGSGNVRFGNIQKSLSLRSMTFGRRSSSMAGYIGDRSKIEQELTMPGRLVSEESVIKGSLLDRSAFYGSRGNLDLRSLLRMPRNSRSSRAIIDTTGLLPSIGLQVGDAQRTRRAVDTTGLLPKVGLSVGNYRSARAIDTTGLLPKVGLSVGNARSERAVVDTSGLLPAVGLQVGDSRSSRAIIDTSDLLPAVGLQVGDSRSSRAIIDTSNLLPAVGLQIGDSRSARAIIDTSDLLPVIGLQVGDSVSSRAIIDTSGLLPSLSLQIGDSRSSRVLFNPTHVTGEVSRALTDTSRRTGNLLPALIGFQFGNFENFGSN